MEDTKQTTKQMRSITIQLDELLNMVDCAYSYGYANDIFLMSMSGLVVQLTDDEIKEYATTTYLTEEAQQQGYNEDDYNEAVERLTHWRDEYIVKTDK